MDDHMDKEDRLRLQHIHLTLLAIQHALSGSRHPDMKAWDQWMRAEGAIAQGSVNIPLTEASPEFHYSLPAEKDLRSLSHEGLGKALHEAMDARSGAIREDENDPNSPIIDWMPIDERWARIMLIHREMDRRNQRKHQRWAWMISIVGVVTSITAVTLSALSLSGFFPAGGCP